MIGDRRYGTRVVAGMKITGILRRLPDTRLT